MEFRTIYRPTSSDIIKITHGRTVVTIGSCFAENIGKKLRSDLFDVLINPLGALYNPVSLLKAVEDALTDKAVTEKDIFLNADNNWCNFDFHSRFSHKCKEKALEAMNGARLQTRDYLQHPDTIVIITLGSARLFYNSVKGETANNCHKADSRLFNVIDLTVEEIVDSLDKLVSLLQDRIKNLSIIMTVSPVRHLSYGFHEDKLSKAKLLLAVDEIVRKYSDIAVYFPAYEVMADDLRDYRFYDTDMLHPSSQAVEYIYGLFKETFIENEEKILCEKCNKLYKRMTHRHSSSPESKFIEATRKLASDLGSLNGKIRKAINTVSYEETGEKILH